MILNFSDINTPQQMNQIVRKITLREKGNNAPLNLFALLTEGILSFLPGVLIWLTSTMLLNAQIKPVTVTTSVMPPYSVYMSDYVKPESNNLMVNITFNDFNEPSWDVYLRLKIEGVGIKISNKPEFKPSLPITLTPGVPLMIKGADLYPYFDYDNLVIEGLTRQQLVQNGRLPEGFYSFCIEVCDYASGKVISNSGCGMGNLSLNESPRMTFPIEGSVVKKQDVQNITFQWQLINNDPLKTLFALSLFEILDNEIDPKTAVVNGKVLKIFESDLTSNTTLLYNSSMPLLEEGKKYAMYVQAQDKEGKDAYKNHGISEISWFYYGYPDKGKIKLVQPENEHGFTLREDRFFKWEASDKTVSGQQVEYQFKIAEMLEGQDLDDAISNPAYFEEKSSTMIGKNGWSSLVSKGFASKKRYVWQVVAYSGSQKVAESNINSFYGPPFMEAFKAGNHTVFVTKTTSDNLADLSGEGKVQISNDQKMHKVYFNNISCARTGAEINLYRGECKAVSELEPIELSGENEENGSAWFYSDSVVLDKDNLKLKGHVQWDLPFATNSKEKAVVYSKKSAILFNEYYLVGIAEIKEDTRFDLLDPLNFSIEFNNTSNFLLRGKNGWKMRFKGLVSLPQKVVGYSESQIKIPFPEVEQLHYNTFTNNTLNNDVLLVKNTALHLQPITYTIDLSEKKSPLKKSNEPDWKGVYFEEYKLHYEQQLDKSNQLYSMSKISRDYKDEISNKHAAFIESKGLKLQLQDDFLIDDLATFNTFPSNLKRIELNIDGSNVTNGFVKGTIKIPLISEQTDFSYTIPLTGNGFNAGYLDSSLDGLAFVHAKDKGDQKLKVRIDRAVFADNERLDMTLSFEWERLKFAVNNLSGFKLWGNYDIGFNIPGGSIALDNRMSGYLDEFPIFIDAIGAAKQPGLYAFGVSTTIVLSGDIAGANGAPVMNVYSIDDNSLLGDYQKSFNKTVDPTEKQNTPKATSSNDASGLMADATDDPEMLLKKQRDINNALIQAQSNALAKADSMLAHSINEQSDGKVNESSIFNAGNVTAETSNSRLSEAQFIELQRRITGEISFMLTPLTSKVDSLTLGVRTKINSFRNSTNQEVESYVSNLVDNLAQDAINASQNEYFDPASVITPITNAIIRETVATITSRINEFVDNEILSEFDFSAAIEYAVSKEVAISLRDAIDDGINTIDMQYLNARVEAIPATFSSSVLNGDALQSQLNAKKNALLQTINVRDILGEIYSGIQQESGKILKDAGVKIVKDLVSDLVSEDLAELTSLADNVPLEFSNIGAMFDPKSGKLTIDRMSVSMNTAVVSLVGDIYYTEGDAKFGNVWRGDILVSINKPKKFSLPVTYITGKYQDFDYWFCSVNGVKDLSNKTPQPLDSEVMLGPLKMVAASGRVYGQMRDLGNDIVPDKNVKYGASLGLVFYDSQQDGKTIRLALQADISTETNGDYVVDFKGDCQLVSPNPMINSVDKNAMAQGEVRINYNSAKSHFVGYGGLVILKPGVLCAQATINVDVQPGKWSLAVGSPEQRVIFVPTCVGWSPTGWLFVNQSMAELGLGLQYSIYASVGFDVGVVGLKVAVDGGIAAGIVVAAQYKPSFVLMKAGVWAELWAKVVVDYSAPLKSGSITLADLYAQASVVIIFNPPPKLIEGDVSGKVEFLGIVSTSFNASFSKTF